MQGSRLGLQEGAAAKVYGMKIMYVNKEIVERVWEMTESWRR